MILSLYTTALGNLFHAQLPSGEEPFANSQPDPPLAQLYATPSSAGLQQVGITALLPCSASLLASESPCPQSVLV